MSTLIQKFLALFSTTVQDHPEPVQEQLSADGMPLAGPTYLREFAHRLGLEVDDLSTAEQSELKRRLDASMDFREQNYDLMYRQVYQLGHGFSLADAERVSTQISEICAQQEAQAYLDYRENAVAAEALMGAASILQNEGQHGAAARLFALADARRHRSSRLGEALENKLPSEQDQDRQNQEPEPQDVAGAASVAPKVVIGPEEGSGEGTVDVHELDSKPGLEGLMNKNTAKGTKDTKKVIK
ncbi:hypothetical protein [Arthrobacter psychrochitiniphilus]|uniref:Uncharacterized protein n=1 Tax=Arthrobacter psychrochitiniphilus TaxID=291045 RepID=A0A2V3DQ16_9MICC|nr:hypothetical protein [Arthrobacter psychrochitiniphilus]NYG17505.1 uncharacterized DUF497 family protein [Arthrobacter psychrochitiniphilus]PXA64619.1 hypothetical protein CVS29_13735 [Arthrobacter psychrochitiniphilus]